MNDFAVVIPSHFADILQPLLESIEKHHKKIPRVVVVQDRNEWDLPSWCEKIVIHSESFCFSRSVNLGIIQAANCDIVCVNDDCRIISDDFFYELADRANYVPNFGIVSPKIKGCAGNGYQMTDGPWPYGATWVELRGCTVESPTLAFVTVYIKRRLIDEIGLLDEGFTHYGFEDTDYCLRARQAGWKTVIFKNPVIMHGDGSPGNARGRNWSLSYARNPDIGSQLNYDYFLRKHDRKEKSS